jgi:hypothetical protein
MSAGNITNTSNDSTAATTGRSAPANKAANQAITANTYIQMLDVLEDLIGHNHTFYDDYTTVCDCQCQCGGGRGTT